MEPRKKVDLSADLQLTQIYCMNIFEWSNEAAQFKWKVRAWTPTDSLLEAFFCRNIEQVGWTT